MNIDYNNFILKIIIPFAATIISIVSLFISTRNTRRSIRVAKLEEILEIIFLIQIYYRPTFILVTEIIRFRKELSDGKVYTNLLDSIKTSSKRHKERFEEKELHKKISKLMVLSNAYLPTTKKNDLKEDIQFLIDLVIDMNRVIDTEGTYLPEYIKAALPRSGEASKLFEKIDSNIIKEMGLGYKNINWDKYRVYRDNYRKKLIDSSLKLE